MIQKLYFGYPINVFDTELEKFLLQCLNSVFRKWYEIESPNCEKHQRGYQLYKQETGNGMDYYSKEVLPTCSAGVFLPFIDKMFGKGVFTELTYFLERNSPVWEVNHRGIIASIFNFDSVQTRVLTVEETRERIRYKDGGLRPYTVEQDLCHSAK